MTSVNLKLSGKVLSLYIFKPGLRNDSEHRYKAPALIALL